MAHVSVEPIALGNIIDLRKLAEAIAPTIERQIHVTIAAGRPVDNSFVARDIANNAIQSIADWPIGETLEPASMHTAAIEELRQDAMRLAAADAPHLRNDAMLYAQKAAAVIAELKRACEAREEMLATSRLEAALLRDLVADHERRARALANAATAV